jgi:aryl-alcohol dehydrogenase-like predicted oxidoreductase
MRVTLGESGFLCIGTANFGSKYGIENEFDGIPTSELKRIFQIINDNPFIGIDTASNYPQAEELIGELLNSKTNKLNTKIGFENYANPELMVESVKRSLFKTKRSRFNTIYLHGGQINNLNYRNSIKEGLSRIKELDFCETLGVSCYTKNEILETVENYQDIGAFQVPENILDQRLIYSEELKQLSNAGIKFEIRSIFLQGSILMRNSKMTEYLKNYAVYFDNLYEMASHSNITVFDLSLKYVLSIPWKSSVVVGVNNFQQFEKLISFDFDGAFIGDYNELKAPEELTDPRRWSVN